MKKFYRITLLLITLVFLSTYSPYKTGSTLKKEYLFFKIKNIEIINNVLVQESEIKKKLYNIKNKNIFTIKEKDIIEPLKSIDFLEKIDIKIKYPDTVIIKVFETKPVAVLFKNKTKYLLDNSSNLISIEDKMNFEEFPKVFGDKAENNFMFFFKKLKNNNFPSKKIKNFYYFQIGRWDLQLVNNKTIKFPHKNIDAAIKKSVELLDREDFKNYNIIDLRLDGKIIVE